MIGVMDAARFLISLDRDSKYFNKKLLNYNGSDFYEGNARLNKMLHLAQNIYIGRYKKKLIDTDFYAYNNGGVALDVQENYSWLLATNSTTSYSVDRDAKVFLRKIFEVLKDAPILELIAIDHEDPAWIERKNYSYKKDQKMNSLKYLEDYKDRYEAINFYLDKMKLV